MVNYQDGKVYKIVCDTTGLVYVGSTCCSYVAQRLAKHASDYKCYLTNNKKYTTSFKVLENNNYKIVLLEKYPCNFKDELTARERYYIETIDCVNKLIPGRTKKEYYIDNKDKIKSRNKVYRDNNKEKRKNIK